MNYNYCPKCGEKLNQVKNKQWYKENSDKFYEFYFNNDEYVWQKDDIQHLVRNGKEIVKGIFVNSFMGGDYLYKENLDSEQKLFHNNQVIEIDYAKTFYPPRNNHEYKNKEYYAYRDNDKKWHLIKDGKELAKADYVFVFPNGTPMWIIDNKRMILKDGKVEVSIHDMWRQSAKCGKL